MALQRHNRSPLYNSHQAHISGAVDNLVRDHTSRPSLTCLDVPRQQQDGGEHEDVKANVYVWKSNDVHWRKVCAGSALWA